MHQKHERDVTLRVLLRGKRRVRQRSGRLLSYNPDIRLVKLGKAHAGLPPERLESASPSGPVQGSEP